MARLDQKFRPYVYALLAFLAAVALYWPTLSLPLIYDSLLHIRIAGELNLLSVWLPTESFGFYRPLTFLPLLLIKPLFGHYPPLLLHGLNVLQHGLNAALLVLLAWRLWRRTEQALAAGLLLALFPFSYQAIVVYGHNVHPTTAGMILLALHSYLSALRNVRWPIGRRQLGKRFWWTLTSVLFLLGLLSHESAVLFGPFAFLMQWAADGRSPIHAGKSISRTLRAPWFLYSLLGIIYLAGYQLLPLSRAPQAEAGGGTWLAKGIYLLQAAAYGFVWPARFLPAAAGTWLILTSAVIVLVLLLIGARTPANRPGLIMAAGWWGLASLLLALPLSANYLLHGPRLLYLSSIGLALLWPLLLAPFGRLARLLPAILLMVILLQNWLFVREKLQVYLALTSPLAEVAQVMTEVSATGNSANEGILLANLPQWISPAKNTFPAGVEISAMLGDYLFAEELIEQNLRANYSVQAISLPEILSQPASYYYGIHEQSDLRSALNAGANGQHVFLISYNEDGPQTRYAGGLAPHTAESDAIASFAGYDLLAARAEHCGAEVILSLTWLPTGEPALSPTTSVFAQLLGADGMMLAQADGPPLGLRPDQIATDAYWELRDRRVMPIAAEQMPATILVGVYDFASGVRAPAAGPDGALLPDNALRLTVEACTD